MSILSRSLTIAFVLGVVASAAGGDGWLSWKPQICWPNCVGKLQADDYCSKCPPHARGPRCFTCDDYDCKCPPKAQCLTQFQCDDYCRKPFAFSCYPLTSHWNPLDRTAKSGSSGTHTR